MADVLELTPAMAVAAERAAVVDHLAEKKGEVQAMIGKRITAADGTMLIRRLDAIADGIAAGLHA